MTILPLRCTDSYCGTTLEIRSTDPMPSCPWCKGKMRPNGPLRIATEEDLEVSRKLDESKNEEFPDGLTFDKKVIEIVDMDSVDKQTFKREWEILNENTKEVVMVDMPPATTIHIADWRAERLKMFNEMKRFQQKIDERNGFVEERKTAEEMDKDIVTFDFS